MKGLYHFEFFCQVGPGTGTGVKLEKNGEHVITADEWQDAGHGSSGNSVSLLLAAGDQVRLSLFRGKRIYSSSYYHYSSFSGRLLFLM